MNVEGNAPAGSLSPYGERIRADTDRLAAAVEHGPLDAPVAACPGWDLRRLAVHLGTIHRWATTAIVEARRPEPTTDPTADVDLAAFLRAGAARLSDALAAADPAAATWHPFPVERTVRIWARRQAQETALHRWDAEQAVFGTSGLDRHQAVEGLEEFFELVLPRIIVREGPAVPSASLRIRPNDAADEWLLRGTDGEYELVPAPAPDVAESADATLLGKAEDLLLVLMQRADRGRLEVSGDESSAAAWLSLPGL